MKKNAMGKKGIMLMKLSRIILETFGLLTNIKIDNKNTLFQKNSLINQK